MKKQNWLNRAKRTAMGRTLCRLLGEENGAVAMEYVVIALLVAAAVVGLVMVFGSNIADMFGTTTKTLGGEAGIEKAAEDRQAQIGKVQSQVEGAKATGKQIRGEKGDEKGSSAAE